MSLLSRPESCANDFFLDAVNVNRLESPSSSKMRPFPVVDCHWMLIATSMLEIALRSLGPCDVT